MADPDRIGDDDAADGYDVTDTPAVALYMLGRWLAELEHEVTMDGATARTVASWARAELTVRSLRRRHAAPVTLDGYAARLDLLASELAP